jgi:hypothetical protein
MATQDISRAAFDPRKQYASVRMQQGRVILDDDWNENERIANEDLRRSRVDIIGPAGSPDFGFRVSNPRVTGQGIDFDIAPGTMYLGGLRLELHQQSQTFRLQSDMLQTPGPGGEPPDGERTDLVVLISYQQPVSAVEDSELFEVALGGPDTTTRLRTMQRVTLWDDVGGDDCETAWQAALKQLAATLSAANELTTDAQLTVTFAALGAPDDLCTPTAAGGYLGAENQAIRIQLVDDSHFTWGFNNAAPLYRVQAAADRRTLTMLTDPKDPSQWPLAEQIVEVLPWAAVLPNNEKVAELRGHLTRVAASYHPDSGELTLVDPIPTAGFDDWTARADAGQLGQGGAYYYLRVWHRGADRTSPPEIPFTPGTAVALGNTGLEITLTGTQFQTADYWIIAARPETPQQVVPWQLEAGRGPHGLRMFAMPLARIHWPQNRAEAPEVDDCRPHFRPLTEQEECCTFTVGDGQSTHGDFDSIEAAVQQLPSSGGQICLLPGLHRANVDIENRVNIKISGCDKNSRVIPRPNQPQEPLFRIVDSVGVTLEHIDMVTVEGAAVVASGSEPGLLRELTVSHNRILAYKNGVHVVRGEGVTIDHNVIRMLDKEGGDVAIYLLADDARIERNDLGVVPPEITPPPRDPTSDDPADNPNPTDPCADPIAFYANVYYLVAYVAYVWGFKLRLFIPKNPFKTLGGIQVGSGSERVEIVANTISGGAGNGITLGSDVEAADLPSGGEAEEPPPQEFKLKNRFDVIWGGVTDGATFLPDIPVVFSGEAGTVTAVTGSDGRFLAKAGPGVYTVTLADPTYRLTSLTAVDNEEFGLFWQINVTPVAPQIDVLDVLAFIYEVSIDSNRISNMGQSGIGIPRVSREALLAAVKGGGLKGIDPSTLALLAMTVGLFGALVGFVIALKIERNRISGCLRNIFDLEADDLGARNRGVGGISLGLCDDLLIRDNRIEDNGVSYRGPAHGIFVIYANQADISRNHVLTNSPAVPSELQQGQPGGITLFAATANRLLAAPADDGLTRADPQAVRLHDNRVHQPLGRALTVMLSLGPISILNNQWVTDFSLAAGAVIGRSTTSVQPKAVIGASVVSNLFTIARSAGVVFVFNLGQITLGSGQVGANASTATATGSTMFNNNQVRLGSAGQSVVAQALVSLDDMSYLGNQADVGAGAALAANTLLAAMTVRAANNRLQEPIDANNLQNRYSLVSYGVFMNSTTFNQGNHCFLVEGNLRRLDTGNLALALSPEQCSAGQDGLKPVGGVYGTRYSYVRG